MQNVSSTKQICELMNPLHFGSTLNLMLCDFPQVQSRLLSTIAKNQDNKYTGYLYAN